MVEVDERLNRVKLQDLRRYKGKKISNLQNNSLLTQIKSNQWDKELEYQTSLICIKVYTKFPKK